MVLDVTLTSGTGPPLAISLPGDNRLRVFLAIREEAEAVELDKIGFELCFHPRHLSETQLQRKCNVKCHFLKGRRAGCKLLALHRVRGTAVLSWGQGGDTVPSSSPRDDGLGSSWRESESFL